MKDRYKTDDKLTMFAAIDFEKQVSTMLYRFKTLFFIFFLRELGGRPWSLKYLQLFVTGCFKVTVDLQGPILSKIIFLHQIQDLTLSEFSKKNYFKNLKHERVIHKNVHS